MLVIKPKGTTAVSIYNNNQQPLPGDRAMLLHNAVGAGSLTILGGIDSFSDAHIFAGANQHIARLVHAYIAQRHEERSNAADAHRPFNCHRARFRRKHLSPLLFNYGGCAGAVALAYPSSLLVLPLPLFGTVGGRFMNSKKNGDLCGHGAF